MFKHLHVAPMTIEIDEPFGKLLSSSKLQPGDGLMNK